MPDLTTILRVGEDALRHLAAFVENPDSRAELTPLDGAADVSIVFADIEGFSDLVAREGDEAGAIVLDVLDGVVAAQLVHNPTARLVKQLGDGVMLSVGDPRAAVRMTAALPHLFAVATAATPHPMRLRAGAHHGTVRPRGEDVIGYHVNVAARVAASAEGGQALVTRALLLAADRAQDEESDHDGAVPEHPVPAAVPAGVLEAKGVPERPPLFLLGELVQPASQQD